MIQSLVIISPPEWPNIKRKYSYYIKPVQALAEGKYSRSYISMVKNGQRENPELKKLIDKVINNG